MTKLTVWNVLAGAYLKSSDLRSTLHHAVEVDAKGNPTRVLCGRVKLEHLCEDVVEYGVAAGIPEAERVVTCKSCLAKVRSGKIRSLIEDSGMSRKQAVALVDAGLE